MEVATLGKSSYAYDPHPSSEEEAKSLCVALGNNYALTEIWSAQELREVREAPHTYTFQNYFNQISDLAMDRNIGTNSLILARRKQEQPKLLLEERTASEWRPQGQVGVRVCITIKPLCHIQDPIQRYSEHPV